MASLDITNLTGTVEQKFMIMLQERIDKLEDQVLSLTNELNEQKELNKQLNLSRFYHISVDIEATNNGCLHPYIDELFRNRSVFQPVFAAWRMLGQNTLCMALALETPTSQFKMKQLMTSCLYTINSIVSLDHSLFKTFFYGDNQHTFKESSVYWWRYVLYKGFETHMTTEPFTSSTNYTGSFVAINIIYIKIYVDHDWFNLLGLDRIGASTKDNVPGER